MVMPANRDGRAQRSLEEAKLPFLTRRSIAAELTPDRGINLLAALAQDFPGQQDDIMEAISPFLADEGIARATALMARILDVLRGLPKGEALLRRLGAPYTDGSLHRAALALGCSPQAVHKHEVALRPYFQDIAPLAVEPARRRNRGIGRPAACVLIGCSSETLAELELAGLLHPLPGPAGGSTYRRRDLLRLLRRKQGGARARTWADLARIGRARSGGAGHSRADAEAPHERRPHAKRGEKNPAGPSTPLRQR